MTELLDHDRRSESDRWMVMLNKAVSAIASQLASKAAWFSSLLLIPGAPWRRQCLFIGKGPSS